MQRAASSSCYHDPELAGTPVRRLVEPPLPSLAAALDASAGGIVNVELKTDGDVASGVAAAFCGLLRRRGGRDRVLASSFDPVALRTVRALRPDLPTALVVGPDGDLGAALREAARVRARALHPSRSSSIARSSSGRVRSASRSTCGRSTTRTSCSASPGSGVDGLITDVPDVALSVLSAPAQSGARAQV